MPANPPGISGVAARPAGVLARHTDVLRDYCAPDDLAAQATPTANIEGHTAYFHNHLPAEAERFILGLLCIQASDPAPSRSMI